MSWLFFVSNYHPVPGANKFDGDLSKWDVSSVRDMSLMFSRASSFNGGISKWDVSRVTSMEKMFHSASSFAQTLCGKWQTSTADKDGMFDGSSGKICTSNGKKSSSP